MSDSGHISVEAVVFTVLEDLGVSAIAARRLETPLVELLLDDDITFEFVPDLEAYGWNRCGA